MFEAERGCLSAQNLRGNAWKSICIYMYIYTLFLSVSGLLNLAPPNVFCEYRGNMGINWPQMVTSAFFDAINSMLGSFFLSTI